MDRALAAAAGWIKTILSSEQKKTDFNPTDTNSVPATASTGACLKACRWVGVTTEKIKECLDGRNVEWVLQELGVRLHRTIYEHLMAFQFASAGAMTLICDMQEYRRCVDETILDNWLQCRVDYKTARLANCL